MSDLDPIIEEFRQIEEEFDIEEAPSVDDEEVIEEVECSDVIEITPENYEVIESDDDTDDFQNELREKRKEDFEYSRKHMKDAINIGADALEDLAKIAKTSESPRAFEVLANLMKSIVDSNERLLETNKKVDEMENAGGIQVIEDKQPVQNQQNNFFLGSTSELQDFINNASTKALEDAVKDKKEE